MRKSILLIIFLLPFINFAQKNKVSIFGNVNIEGKNNVKSEVYIAELDIQTETDNNGNYSFHNIPKGSYSLYAIYDNFISNILYLNVENTDLTNIDILFDSSPIVLEEVTIKTRKKIENLRSSSIKADIIDVEAKHKETVNLEELMNRTSGIKIRNIGGLGSASKIIVGGFTGHSVRFLYDDIPIDYLGSGFGLTKVPLNMIERVDIYKGVLPPQLGIDALGSVINLIPKKMDESGLSVSFQQGSYATSIATLNAYTKLNDKLYLGVNSFYNYSKNNYEVDNLQLVDEETGQNKYIKAKLFHNSFKQYFAETFIQLKDVSWADQVELKLSSYGLKRDIQNDFSSRNRPFGKVHRTESGRIIPSLKYNKYFFDERLKVTQFLAYSHINFALVDKLKNTYYDWQGKAHTTISGSEMGSALENRKGELETTLNQFTSRTLLNYDIDSNKKISFNIIDNYYYRISDDSFKENNRVTTTYNRFISNLGYTHLFLDKTLESITQLKYLSANTKGEIFDEVKLKYNQKKTPLNGWSFSQSLKYDINESLLIRISAENTFRLPDQAEVFGDNNFILSNIHLKPEKSNNINLGMRLAKPEFTFELNSYYRNTKNLIRLRDINQYQAQFLNLENVNGLGIEMDLNYSPLENILLSGNITWNDFRLSSSNDTLSSNNHFKDARVSNMPFLFGNLGITYSLKNIIVKSDNINIYWNYSYTHQYYLDFVEKQFEPDGFLHIWGNSKIYTNRIIPIQHLNSLGFNWTNSKKRNSFSFGFEVKNIFNRPIFNEFKMQSPGRNFTTKLTYNLD